ncbi:shikimate dehydrogenase family protein [Dermabacteraceae bacterium P9123]
MIGSPIGHSLSPLLHNSAYRLAGITDARYLENGIDLATPAQADEFLARTHLQGLSVTMPLKPWAAEVADESDETVAALGIANTLLRLPDGRWRAENHDVYGIVAALRRYLLKAPRRAVIFGSGATATSAAEACRLLGVKQLIFLSRRNSLNSRMLAHLKQRGVTVEWQALSDPSGIPPAELVISTLPAHAAEQVMPALAPKAVSAEPSVFLDVLYSPFPPPVAARMQETYPRTVIVCGEEMLLQQALAQVSAMTGVEVVDTQELRAALAAAKCPAYQPLPTN